MRRLSVSNCLQVSLSSGCLRIHVYASVSALMLSQPCVCKIQDSRIQRRLLGYKDGEISRNLEQLAVVCSRGCFPWVNTYFSTYTLIREVGYSRTLMRHEKKDRWATRIYGATYIFHDLYKVRRIDLLDAVYRGRQDDERIKMLWQALDMAQLLASAFPTNSNWKPFGL